MNNDIFISDEIHQIFEKCVTNNMIRFKDFKHIKSQIFYLCENLRISSKGSMDLRGKCVLWSLKPFFVIAAFCTKVCSLTHRIKWGIWNEKSNCILPSSLAKKKLYPYKSCYTILVTHNQFPNTFSFEFNFKILQC